MLDFWIAFDAVEPIGDEWAQTASVRLGLANLEGMLAAQAGVKLDPPDFNDFMPPRYTREHGDAPSVVVADPKEQFLAIGRALGFDPKQVSENCGWDN